MRSDRLPGRQTPAWRTGEEAAPAVLQSAFSSVRQADGYGLDKPGCAVTTRSTTAQPNHLRALTYLLTLSRLYGPVQASVLVSWVLIVANALATAPATTFMLPTTSARR